MTTQQLLEDIRSDRIKKVIMDGDYNGEIDDQYTLAYALGSPKLEVLGVCASAQYAVYDEICTEEIMRRAMHDVKTTYEALDLDPEVCPLFEGAKCQIANNPNLEPTDSPAARFIMECAHKYDETIYILVTGPCTNVVSACMMDPSIIDKIAVLWLGGNCLYNNRFHEWNLYSDYAAGQYLLNLPIPLLWLPCDPDGSVVLRMDHSDLDRLKGSGKAAYHLKRGLPLKIFTEEKFDDPNWFKIMCDYMAVAALTVPDAIEMFEETAPVITDDQTYAIDSTRRKILCGVRPDNRRVIDDSIEALNRVISARE